MLKGFCPNCEKETEIKRYDVVAELILGKEKINVVIDTYECTECNETWDNPQATNDPLADAYAEYARRTGKKWTGNRNPQPPPE